MYPQQGLAAWLLVVAFLTFTRRGLSCELAKASVQWQLCNLCAPIALELLSISLLGGARPLYYYYYYY